jgi:hypothetical protein
MFNGPLNKQRGKVVEEYTGISFFLKTDLVIKMPSTHYTIITIVMIVLHTNPTAKRTP